MIAIFLALLMSVSQVEGRTLRIETPRAYAPLLEPARYKGLRGGRGAGRSHFFGELCVETCVSEPGTKFVCFREHQVSLEQSVKSLIEEKIEKHGLGRLFRVMDNEIRTPGDGLILFKGLKSYTVDSIKSLEGYRYAWVEEAQTLSARSLKLLRPTMREEWTDSQGRLRGSEMWFSWNPRLPTDPIERFLNGPDGPPPNSVVITSTWRDNPWFPQSLMADMDLDRARDFESYSHVWEGAYETKSEARVFKNWKIDRFPEPPVGTPFYLGADWGFSKDPSTLVRMWVQGRNLFVDYELYKVGVEIDHLPAFFDELIPGVTGWARQQKIVADSARPETISYMQRHNYPRMEAAKKGPDSLREGVIFLQGYDIVVHERCAETIDELTNYAYKVDPLTSEVVVPNVLEDKKNHIIDPMRYAVEALRKPKEWVSW